MKNFTYKTLIKYLLCAFCFAVSNSISFQVPFSIAFLPAFMGNAFAPFFTAILFSCVALFFFTAKQVAILLAYKLDVFENIPKKEIKAKANELIDLLTSQYPEYVNEINQSGDITDAVEKIFTKTMLEFKQ